MKNEEQTRIEEETKSSREIRGKGELLLGGMHGVVKRIYTRMLRVPEPSNSNRLWRSALLRATNKDNGKEESDLCPFCFIIVLKGIVIVSCLEDLSLL